MASNSTEVPHQSFTPEKIHAFYAPLLLGALIALSFSGMIAVQAIVYFKLYPEDSYFKKGMVILVWVIDLIHSVIVCLNVFDYFITFYNQQARLDQVSWTVSGNFFVTGVQTVITHSFFAHKIHRSGGSNWWLTSPIIVLIITRLGVVAFAAIQLLLSGSFTAFIESKFSWSFTAGLSVSASIDVVITGCLFFFLRRIRTKMSTMMTTVVDSLTWYTMESGFLTCFATCAVLITWITLRHSFVGLGIHFSLAKLYINSLLASLNTRKELREMRDLTDEGTLPPPIFSPADFASIRPRHPRAIVNPIDVHLSSRRKQKIEINVRKKVEHQSDSLATLSNMMYPRTAPLTRPTVLEWKSGSYNSLNTLSSAQTDVTA